MQATTIVDIYTNANYIYPIDLIYGRLSRLLYDRLLDKYDVTPMDVAILSNVAIDIKYDKYTSIEQLLDSGKEYMLIITDSTDMTNIIRCRFKYMDKVLHDNGRVIYIKTTPYAISGTTMPIVSKVRNALSSFSRIYGIGLNGEHNAAYYEQHYKNVANVPYEDVETIIGKYKDKRLLDHNDISWIISKLSLLSLGINGTNPHDDDAIPIRRVKLISYDKWIKLINTCIYSNDYLITCSAYNFIMEYIDGCIDIDTSISTEFSNTCMNNMVEYVSISFHHPRILNGNVAKIICNSIGEAIALSYKLKHSHIKSIIVVN